MSQQDERVSIIPELEPHTEANNAEQPNGTGQPTPVPPAPATGKPLVHEPHKGEGLSSEQVAQMTGGEQETEVNMALDQAEGVEDTSES